MTPIGRLFERRGRQKRFRMQDRGLPGFVVLLQIALAGGQTPRVALTSLGRFASDASPLGAACAAISQVAHRLELGASFDAALLTAEKAMEISPSTHRVLDLLRRSEHDGEPVLLHLDIVLVELRRQRANALDAAAQRLTVFLLFPLVLCILPAFIVLAVVPLVIGALAGLPT